MTAQFHKTTEEEEYEERLRNLVRVVSACTFGALVLCCRPTNWDLLSVLNNVAGARQRWRPFFT